MKRTTRLLAAIALCCLGREALADYQLSDEERKVIGERGERRQQTGVEKRDTAWREILDSRPKRLKSVFDSVLTADKVREDTQLRLQVARVAILKESRKGRQWEIEQAIERSVPVPRVKTTPDGLSVDMEITYGSDEGASRQPEHILPYRSYPVPTELLKTQGFAVVNTRDGAKLLDLLAWKHVESEPDSYTASDALVSGYAIDRAAEAAYRAAQESIEAEKNRQAARELSADIKDALEKLGK